MEISKSAIFYYVDLNERILLYGDLKEHNVLYGDFKERNLYEDLRSGGAQLEAYRSMMSD